MKKAFQRLFSVLLALILSVSILPLKIFTSSAAGYTTGDIITFGSYPQTKVTDADLISALNAQPLQGDDTITYGGSRYKRVYFTQYTPEYSTLTPDASNSSQDNNGYYINTVYWFKFEPVQWRVLSDTNGELFVLAEKILASRAYNQVNADVTWETCTMRSWLNNEFYNTAFNSTEQAKIKTSTVVNEDNLWYSTNGGNNTSDKVFLLSYSEVMNTAYGFSSDYSTYDTARRTQGSDFAKSNGLWVNTYDSSYLGNSVWWLRSPGDIPSCTGNVNTYGYVNRDNTYVDYTYVGARPALKLNPASFIFSSKNGSNCRIDFSNEFIYGLTPGITSLDNDVETAPGCTMSYVPTANGFGTGTVVNGLLGGKVMESYTVIIFGDVNGDGNINSIDAGIMVNVENYVVSWDPAADAAWLKAADVNGDGNVNGLDAGIAIDVENYIFGVNQVTGVASAKEPIEGTVTIDGTAKFGETLTADVSGILPSGTTVSYTWKRGAAVVGTGSAYTITAEDIGKSIIVTVNGTNVFTGSIRSSAAVPVKADRPAPSKPFVINKTPYKVTLQYIEGQEYKIEGGAWQQSAEFTGLSPNTAYNFYTRTAETQTHFASPDSLALSVTTYTNMISGTVAIAGMAIYGGTLTAVIANVLPSAADFTYEWKRGDTVIGNNASYTVTVDDIGQPVTLTVTGTGDYSGSVASSVVIPVKASAAVPSAPELISKTSSSVALTAVAGREYKIEGGAWQQSNDFNGLNPNTAYNFYTRIAETQTHYASPASAALSVTTDKATISGTVAITGNPSVGNTLTADISGILPTGATLLYKWKADGVQVGTGSTYPVIEIDLGCSITVTVTGTGAYEGSLTSAPMVIT